MKITWKQLLKSKTLWASLAAVCTGIGALLTGDATLQEFSMTALGLVFGLLRFVTDKPLTDK